MKWRCITIVVFISAFLLNAAHAEESSDSKWYVGMGGGVSKLDPDMGGSGFQLSRDSDSALSIALGLDLSPRYSVELGATQLGKASLGENRTVSYQSMGVSTLLRVLGDRTDVANSQGFWGYARLGVNRIDNSGSTVSLSSSDGTAFQLGAGIEWAVAPRWSVRSELNQYDSDARSATLALVWRSRVVEQRDIEGPRPATEKRPEIVPRVDAPQAAPPKAAPPNIIPGSRLDADDGDCAVPAPGEPLDDRGCAVFSGISDIAFVGGTDQLQSGSLATVKRLASALMQYSSVNIEIGAHSVSPEGSKAALLLSRQRAIALARALVAEGVPVSRLQARAFGDSVRRVAGTDYLNPLNNRIVLNVINSE